MLAPAQKNFSPRPVMTMRCTSLSMRACLKDGRTEVLHHLVGVAVERRIVEREQRDSGECGVVDESHGDLSTEAAEKVLPSW
jgi:hypothetical protein